MGYRAQQQQQQSNSEQVFSQNRRRSRLPWIIGIIIVATVFSGFMGQEGFFFELGFFRSFLLAVFLIGVIWWFVSTARGRGRLSLVNQRSVETRSFTVGMHPTIVIRDSLGTIRVHPLTGEGNEVIIQATKRSRGWMGNSPSAQVDYQQNGDSNMVTAKAVGGGWAKEGDIAAGAAAAVVVADVEGAVARFSPHSTQKRAPVTIGAPHCGQKRTVTSEAAHFRARASRRGY